MKSRTEQMQFKKKMRWKLIGEMTMIWFNQVCDCEQSDFGCTKQMISNPIVRFVCKRFFVAVGDLVHLHALESAMSMASMFVHLQPMHR